MSITVKNVGWTDTLVATFCGDCHIPFAVPSNLDYWARKDGRSFYCPNGHRLSYTDNENKRLNREVLTLRGERDAARVARDAAYDQAQAAERRRAAAKGQLTKTRRRIANGVCPCCNRTFADVARHMASKHPDYAPETPPETA